MTRRTTGAACASTRRTLWDARYVGAGGRRHSLYRRTVNEPPQALRAALTHADAAMQERLAQRMDAVLGG